MTVFFVKSSRARSRARKVYEDESCMAFYDIEPQMPVHIVVAAKRHVPSVLGFSEQDAEFLGRIQLAVAEIARKLNLTETASASSTIVGRTPNNPCRISTTIF